VKPVQLLPSATAVEAAGPANPSGLIMVVVAGLVVIGVAGYFEWGKLTDVNAMTAKTQADTQQATADAAKLDQQILEAGNSKTDYTGTADTVSQEVVQHLNERVKYAGAVRELRSVVPKNVWLKNILAANPDSANAGSTGDSVTLEGYAKSMTDIAAFVTRLNSTNTYVDAHTSGATTVQDNKGKDWYNFKIGANLAGAGTSLNLPGGDGTSPLVANKKSGNVSELSLDPDPDWARKQAKLNKPKPKPKPLSNLEKVARAATNYGGGA